jgi:hypothetical protein
MSMLRVEEGRVESSRTNYDGSVQSAVQSLSVAEVRRALSFIRKTWEDQQSDKKARPFYLSDILACTKMQRSIEAFSLSFILAHHTRRLTKPRDDGDH